MGSEVQEKVNEKMCVWSLRGSSKWMTSRRVQAFFHIRKLHAFDINLCVYVHKYPERQC